MNLLEELVRSIAKRYSEYKNGTSFFHPALLTDNFCLYHGDALELLRFFPDNSIDLVFADPPYFLSNDGISVKSGKRVSVNKGEWDRSLGFDSDMQFYELWITEIKRILKPEGTIWISGTYHNIYKCGYLLQKLDFRILNEIVWYKPNAAPNLSCTTFAHSHETLIWARKSKKSKHTFNYEWMKNYSDSTDIIKREGKQMRSVWAIPAVSQSERDLCDSKRLSHPTQKPLKLLKRIIMASAHDNSIILDPFSGVSTTGIAMLTLLPQRSAESKLFAETRPYFQNLYYIGIEIERQYVDDAIARYRCYCTSTEL